jgi:hypothetical protein
MTWVKLLENLPLAVAMLIVLVWAIRQNNKSTITTIETISKHIVEPLKNGIEKSVEAVQSEVRQVSQRDLEERLEDREDRRLTRETYAVMGQEFQRLCLRLNGQASPGLTFGCDRGTVDAQDKENGAATSG